MLRGIADEGHKNHADKNLRHPETLSSRDQRTDQHFAHDARRNRGQRQDNHGRLLLPWPIILPGTWILSKIKVSVRLQRKNKAQDIDAEQDNSDLQTELAFNDV